MKAGWQTVLRRHPSSWTLDRGKRKLQHFCAGECRDWSLSGMGNRCAERKNKFSLGLDKKGESPGGEV